MSVPPRESLDHDSWRVYDYIARHFMATVSADCKYLVTEVELEAHGERFVVQGKRLLSAGFTGVMHWQALPADQSMPDLRFHLLPRFTGFYWVLLGFTGFYWVLLAFHWVFTGIYGGSSSFTGFSWHYY